jgi:curved DNA-binding protein CbpA
MKTSKSHYETLGVKPDASPKEIKNARRRKAARSHPDHGGDQVEMSAINHAFDVLIDPKRRLLYDATGEDSQQSEEATIRALITQVFADGLAKDVPHVLNHAKDLLTQGKSTLERQITETTKRRDKLKAKSGKIKTKAEENIFQNIIDQQIIQCDQQIAKAEFDLDMCVKASKELKKYESAEEVPTYTMSDLRFSNQWGVFGSAST